MQYTLTNTFYYSIQIHKAFSNQYACSDNSHRTNNQMSPRSSYLVFFGVAGEGGIDPAGLQDSYEVHFILLFVVFNLGE